MFAQMLVRVPSDMVQTTVATPVALTATFGLVAAPPLSISTSCGVPQPLPGT